MPLEVVAAESEAGSAVRGLRLRPPRKKTVGAVLNRLLPTWCAACAREVSGGAVLSRGSVFCSTECAAEGGIPGLYLG